MEKLREIIYADRLTIDYLDLELREKVNEIIDWINTKEKDEEELAEAF